MTVSVVVPTRNRPEMLRTCLDSISRQSVSNVHIVVIDDGSTPEQASLNKKLTLEISHSATYHHMDSAGSKGAGPAFARNVGISLAKCDFVAFCDDDDYWIDERYLAECVRLFDEDSDLDLVFASQEVRHGGKVSDPKQTVELPRRLGIDSTPTGGAFPLSKDDCLLGWYPHLNTCVFRRQLLERIGGFWGTACFEDLDLYVRAVDVARKVCYLDRTVACHNNAESIRREAVTTQLSKMDIEVCAINVAAHIIHAVRTQAAILYARRMAGNAYRLLAEDANRRSDLARALAFARLGLAAKFSAKWSLVTAFFSVREWLQRRTA
jgi:glycosyltransferase involved in cell wall biosynthesis